MQLGSDLVGDRSGLGEDRSELEGDRGELEGDWGELECLLAAAQLARRGRQQGSQHGCVLIEDYVQDSVEDSLEEDGVPDAPRRHRRRLLGQGWNHAYIGRDLGKRTSRHVHAEAHAIADAICRRGKPLTSAHGLGPSLMPQTRHMTPVHAVTTTFARTRILGCLA